jgi:hypothetical protein
MSNRDINRLKGELLKNRIELSDTISQFMEKCNNNFSAIIEWGGGPAGEKGEMGNPGAPTKPKVPIHVWRENIEYDYENTISSDEYIINEWYEDLSDIKYQDGHLIMLKNAHVYILESDNFGLKPKYLMGLQSFNPADVIDGKNAYIHIAYSNAPNSSDGFITDQQLRGDSISTFSLRRDSRSNPIDKAYMGVYSDNNIDSSTTPSRYTWVKIQGGVGPQGVAGPVGPQGEKGDKGDGYIGHPYTIDLEGDMSTISIDSIKRTRLNNDYCICTLHTYYGDENVPLSKDDVTINLPENYKSTYRILDNGEIISKSNTEDKIGKIEKIQSGKDVIIKFIPDEHFMFPKNSIIFPISVNTKIYDRDADTDYSFGRNTVWMIKGITSTFKLEIIPQYRSIKLFEDGKYYPETLNVNVYKVEDGERNLFDFSQNNNFKLLYKNLNDKTWSIYNNGIRTQGVSCLEFKIVNNYNSDNEEIWDYEDVWVVADGKGAHYYHADLGSTESMMVLTTGEKINIGTKENPIYCAELRNESGYTIYFDPKFYDGTTELTVVYVNIGSIKGDEYGNAFEKYLSFDQTVGKYKFEIKKVPFGVDMIPMTFDVLAQDTAESDSDSDVEYKNDTVSFNVYISTLSDTYTLVPTVSSYNVSTGKDGVDTIGCNVYKNNIHIETTDLNANGLSLNYIVHDGTNSIETDYEEPLVFGVDDDTHKDDFTASDVAIEFILYYRNNVVVRSTVPLIKDGINGIDGDSWQYIFCRSPKYPFEEYDIDGVSSNPNNWKYVNNVDKNPDNEYIPDEFEDIWTDDHQGVDNVNRYEYQSYRKWDKTNKKWSEYTTPTLYSNYAESGSGYSVLLSNPVAVIPVGNDDWSVNEDNVNQSDSTLVYLYNNTTDISDFQSVSVKIDESSNFANHFESKRNSDNIYEITFKPVVGKSVFDFGSNTQYKLPIIITYDLGADIDNDGKQDIFITTINWTLTPIQGLEDAEVFVDKRVVNISNNSKHNLQVGYYLISTNGSKQFISDSVLNNNKGYQIILTDDINQLKPSSNNGAIICKDWKSVEYNFVNNDGDINCYVVLVEEINNTYTIIDYVNVTPVRNGEPGQKGDTITCTSTSIVGYSTTMGSLDPKDKTWKKTIDALESLSSGQTIYMLNEQTWSNNAPPTYYISSTLAGTQGISGKSRVLFYLGSFKDKTLTTSGEAVEGKLTDDRCDYYIDQNGNAWMRTGTAESAVANPTGASDDNWKASDTVGFLKAGAIHADMINTGSLVANGAFITDLKSRDIIGDNISGKTIKIINDTKNTMVLPGYHNYENKSDDNSKGRTITLSSGIYDRLYKWRLDESATAIIDNDENNSIITPPYIYTTYNYENSYSGTEIVEIYYNNEGKMFIWDTFDYALVYPKNKFEGVDNVEDYIIESSYIKVTINSVKYKYNLNASIDISADTDSNFDLQIETASTKIYSDGTIYTNSIIANDGEFSGNIYSDGEFSGRLINANGTIKNASISNTSITLSNNDKFIARIYDYKKCDVCDNNTTVIQCWYTGSCPSYLSGYSYGNIEIDFGDDWYIQLVNILFNIRKDMNNANSTNYKKPDGTVLDNYLSEIDDYEDKGLLICNDNRKVKDCSNDEIYKLVNINKSEFINLNAKFGNIYIWMLHLLYSKGNPIISKEESISFNNDEGAISTDFLNIIPQLSIDGVDETITAKGAHLVFEEKNSHTKTISNYKYVFLKTYVSSGSQLKIHPISFDVSGFQPRKNEGKLTDPKIVVCWKYINSNVENTIQTLDNTVFDINSPNKIEYNGKKYVWNGKKTNEYITDIATSGEIEIYAKFTATIRYKSLTERASITFYCPSFNVETKSSFTPKNNTITITKSGIIIKGKDGGVISTIDDNIKIVSGNGKHSLIISDEGIKVHSNGNTKIL